MTMIAAMKFDDHFLIGSDTKVSQAMITSKASKLDYIISDDFTIAWGFSGDLGVGREFNCHMHENIPKTFSDWRELRENVSIALGSLNSDLSFTVPEAGPCLGKMAFHYMGGVR